MPQCPPTFSFLLFALPSLILVHHYCILLHCFGELTDLFGSPSIIIFIISIYLLLLDDDIIISLYIYIINNNNILFVVIFIYHFIIIIM